MKKIIKPTKPKPEKYIFTEGINYFETGKTSIFGKGDEATIKFLNKLSLSGNWLNVCAGDGRYNTILLKKTNKVMASDFDAGALSKLWYYTSKKLRNKLKIKLFNVVKRFPFENGTFDGIFCTGVLHLFPKKILNQIFSEFHRVLKSNSLIIMDFAADVKRRYPDGRLRFVYKNEPRYKLKTAMSMIKKMLKGYDFEEIVESEVYDDLTKTPGLGYEFYCKFFVLKAQKSQNKI